MMFERLIEVAANVQNLSEKRIAVEIFSNSMVQRYIINLNRISQLFEQGKDSSGNVIGYYSELTQVISAGQSFQFEGFSHQKIAGEPYTLLDTSYFYKSFTVILTENGFAIEADDEKDGEYLTERYGQKILGLSIESKNDLARHILNQVIELVRKEILA